MKFFNTLFAQFLMAVFLLFIPVNVIAADSNLNLTNDEIKELERLEELVRGDGATPASAQDNSADKVADEKRKKAVAARIADEKQKKAEAARIADEKRKKAEAARKASEKAAATAADNADASSAAKLKVLDIKFRIMKIMQAAMERKLAALEAKEKAKPSPVQISGFVDMAWTNTPNDVVDNTFGIDQMELDFAVALSDKADVGLDLNFVRSDSGLFVNDLVEQAFININVGERVTLTFGKWNTPIGVEGGEPTEMYQYSLAGINTYTLPGDITGVMVTFGGELFEVNLYYINGNDMALGTMVDDNKEKTVGGHIAITPIENMTLGVSHISGDEGADPNQGTLAITDVDFSWNPKQIEALTIFGQFNTGTWDGQSAIPANSGDDAKWSGYLVKVNYVINDTFNITARHDSFNDKEGAMIGNAVDETQDSWTGALLFGIADGLGGLVEYKSTKSNKETFTDKNGNPKDSATTLALELTYAF